MIVYEYPLNERMRTLLRLEDLFERVKFFLARREPLEHHAALLTLFEILEVAGRADLKSDLIQELERQKQILMSFRSNPDIAEVSYNGSFHVLMVDRNDGKPMIKGRISVSSLTIQISMTHAGHVSIMSALGASHPLIRDCTFFVLQKKWGGRSLFSGGDPSSIRPRGRF